MEKIVSVKLDITLFDAVKKYAKENDMRMSQVIRSAIKQRINFKYPVVPSNTQVEESDPDEGNVLHGWTR